MILPLQVNVLFPRQPYANVGIIAVCTLVFILQLSATIPDSAYEYLLLTTWGNPIGWFTSLFLHAGFMHFVGNMIFLWVFGNAICSKVGNWRYLGLYFAFGLAACWLHLIFEDMPALGASGAINGVIGFYFALYPNNYMRILWGLFPFYMKQSDVTSKWIVLYWLFWDVIGVLIGDGDVAYWAHLGGFVGGFALAVIFLKYRLIEFRSIDNEHLFEKWFSRFNVDELNKENYDCVRSLKGQEFEIQRFKTEQLIGPIDSEKLARLRETKAVEGRDYVFCEKSDEWLECSRFFTRDYLEKELNSQVRTFSEEEEISVDLYRLIHNSPAALLVC